MNPMAGKIIVQPIIEDKVTSSGIILLGSVSKVKALRGEVIRVSKRGCMTKPGDSIWFNVGMGTQIEDGSKTYLVLDEDKCLCAIPKAA